MKAFKRISIVGILLYWAFVAFFVDGAAGASSLSSDTCQQFGGTPTPSGPEQCLPAGTAPAGWGTYTPSPGWNVDCRQCVLTLMPIPTQSEATVIPPVCVPGPTVPPGCGGAACPPTPVPCPGDVTPTPTGGTVTPTPSPSTLEIVNAVSCDDHYDTSTCSFTCSAVDGVVTCSGSSYVVGNNGQEVIDYYANVKNTSSSPADVYVQLTSGGGCFYHSWQTAPGGYWGAAPLVDRFTISGVAPGAGTVNHFFSHLTYCQSASSSIQVIFSTKGYPGNEPTPTPAPTALPSACYSIIPPPPPFDWDIFIPDGPPVCDLGWSEIPLGEDNVLPAFELCIQPVLFGVITLFGADFELGPIAIAAAVAFFYRFLRTS